ncbi:hypothetical protein [Streptomyces mangrovisoli]|uniref:Integral membrane protein n=1 Tax=Streptomyces mangrovisoli TaxID=1428628 RepID=A0A1J4NL41_9ACTN|nr:hypothetical protein WN71_036020 [Streptomyces mangrovisoli]
MKTLMHRHRDLCERAVDPLEIAAGLEAHGLTDRTAARFRHRDVFSLAEEIYARVPRDTEPPLRPAGNPADSPPPALRAHVARVLLTLLPGLLCAATVGAVRLTHGQPHLAAALAGALAVTAAAHAALGSGPLGTPPGAAAHPSRLATPVWTYWLLGYALLGDALLAAVLRHSPGTPDAGAVQGVWSLATAPVLALTLALAPATWCAHLFTGRAARRLEASRGLAEFTAGVRPLLLGTFALFLSALAALLAGCAAVLGEPAPYAQTLALGALLLPARLLVVHGRARAAGAALGAAVLAEAAALALPLSGRLPGCAFLATPVESLVDSGGPGIVPVLACGAAALSLLIHATRALATASAHARPVKSP